jgi:NAD(P)H-hydrate epimerase
MKTERLERKDFAKIIPPRKPNSHKGDYGHVLILAGSVGLTGAATLCSQATLLSGSGLVTLGIPESLNPIMESKLTEVMTKPLVETSDLSLSLDAEEEILKFIQRVDAVAIGPGLSRNEETQVLVRRLVGLIDKSIVIDADGINALIGHLNKIKNQKSKIKNLILTPHPGEMARLLRISIDEVQKRREEIAKKFAQDYKLTLVLKGHRTVVSDYKGNLYINKTGNPGMATAGSGDILTGMIASFLGQGIAPFDAARLAVYLHGLAGDLAAKEKGEISLIASDILDNLSKAIKKTFYNK